MSDTINLVKSPCLKRGKPTTVILLNDGINHLVSSYLSTHKLVQLSDLIKEVSLGGGKNS